MVHRRSFCEQLKRKFNNAKITCDKTAVRKKKINLVRFEKKEKISLQTPQKQITNKSEPDREYLNQ